jgi:hypothetical protein
MLSGGFRLARESSTAWSYGSIAARSPVRYPVAAEQYQKSAEFLPGVRQTIKDAGVEFVVRDGCLVCDGRISG